MGQKSKKYDVVIVGGGVIGGALALRLSQLNYDVALIDKTMPSYKTIDPERVIALSAGSMRYFQSLGVWDAMRDLGAGLIKNIVAFEPDHDGQVDMSHQELGEEALGYVFEIRHVLQPLYTALQGNVNMYCPAQCLSYQQLDQGVVLDVQTEQGKVQLQASLLVAADGTLSHIRNLAGIQTYGWDHNRMAIVASVQTKHGHGNLAYECFREEGPVALLPLADGRFSLVWSVAPAKAVALMKLKKTSFLKALSIEIGCDALQRTGVLQTVGKRAMFPLELRLAQSFAQGNVLLVGNAAHTIHPIAGQGMNLGLRDVAVLADILSQDWAKANLNQPLIAQTYNERRRLDVMAVVGFTEGVLEVFASKFLPLTWLRGKGLQTIQSVPKLKHILLQQAASTAQLKGLNL